MGPSRGWVRRLRPRSRDLPQTVPAAPERVERRTAATLSVVVPVLGEQRHLLEACLDGLQRQTHPALQVVVVGPARLARRHATDPRIRQERSVGEEPAALRAAGAGASVGD